MVRVNPVLEEGHLPYLLDLGLRRINADLQAIVDPTAFPDLRGSHFRILSMIPPNGARPSELAEVAQITRPALGELLAHLRQQGYVEAAPDQLDGRALVMRLTRQGRRAAGMAEKAIAELRRQWAAEIGEDRIAALIDALTALTLERAPSAATPAPR